jgi:hypothetical protein
VRATPTKFRHSSSVLRVNDVHEITGIIQVTCVALPIEKVEPERGDVAEPIRNGRLRVVSDHGRSIRSAIAYDRNHEGAMLKQNVNRRAPFNNAATVPDASASGASSVVTNLVEGFARASSVTKGRRLPAAAGESAGNAAWHSLQSRRLHPDDSTVFLYRRPASGPENAATSAGLQHRSVGLAPPSR